MAKLEKLFWGVGILKFLRGVGRVIISGGRKRIFLKISIRIGYNPYLYAKISGGRAPLPAPTKLRHCMSLQEKVLFPTDTSPENNCSRQKKSFPENMFSANGFANVASPTWLLLVHPKKD